jgi:predicted ferric reductase
LPAPDRTSPKRLIPAVLIWTALLVAMIAPILIATTSPYLAYRNAPYVVGGFAGILCLPLLLVQPLLAAGYLPGLHVTRARRWHHWVGAGIITCVVLHVAGLYVTSPPDTLDALLLVAPTPFSVYGVTAMWGAMLTAVLVLLRRRLGLRYPAWRLIHNGLALVVVAATVIHALQIEGAMGTMSKWALCLAVLLATGMTLLDLRVIRPFFGWRTKAKRPVTE